ncbi:hypothetical protein [Methylocella sp.]|uniref:hypothetical protein n=1 Tax=Methylocella sp. TaxID=1978226 RepID=UPI003783B6D4
MASNHVSRAFAARLADREVTVAEWPPDARALRQGAGVGEPFPDQETTAAVS